MTCEPDQNATSIAVTGLAVMGANLARLARLTRGEAAEVCAAWNDDRPAEQA